MNRSVIAANALEALGNYQIADQPLVVDIAHPEQASEDSFYYIDDQEFWRVFTSSDNWYGEVEFDELAVSEWVARIPGLYWSKGAEKLRQVAPENIESRTANWVTYSPLGKSQKVTGGIGTVKLPPSESGYRLCSLTTTLNASAGTPVLVSPEVWEHHRLSEGRVVAGKASVRPMPVQWAREFPSLKGIPRLCIVLDKPDALTVPDDKTSVLIHPFTIMEYWEHDKQLLDFVYAATDASDPEYRGELEQFFEGYRQSNDRNGSYLVAADIAQPMWDAEFTSPAQMRGEKAPQLNLIERRVQDNFKGESVIDPLLAQLTSAPDSGNLIQVSDLAGIPHSQWSRSGTQADEASHLVAAAVHANKVAELVLATEQVLNQ